MDYSWAKPGVKCVCVDASAGWTLKKTGLITGRIYTVCRYVPPNPEWNRNPGVPGIHLLEHPSHRDEGWAASRFRPLITKTQEEDVAMFKSLVTGAPMGVEA